MQGRRLRGRAAYACQGESSNLPGRDRFQPLAHERVITSGAGPTTRVSEGPPPGVCGVQRAARSGGGRSAVPAIGGAGRASGVMRAVSEALPCPRVCDPGPENPLRT